MKENDSSFDSSNDEIVTGQTNTLEVDGKDDVVDTKSSTIELEKNQEFEQSQFKVVSVKKRKNSMAKAGVLSIINSSKNGKRVMLAKELVERIGNPEAVVIATNKNKLAISGALINDDSSFKLSTIGSKYVIYSTDLVKILTETYNIDFSDRVCATFDEVIYESEKDKLIAVITIS